MRPRASSRRIRGIAAMVLASLTACTGSVVDPTSPATSAASSVAATGSPTITQLSTTMPAAMLVWTQNGLLPGFADGVAHLPGVQRSVAVVAGTVWLTGSRSATGVVVDHPPAGMAIPLDLAGATPSTLAPFLPPTDRHLVAGLRAGEAILGATSARLRRLGPGGLLRFGATQVKVAGVVPDEVIGAHEVFVSQALAATLGVGTQRYLLVQPATGVRWALIRRLVPAGTLLRIREPDTEHFLRQADAVLPPVMMKAAFGEFEASPHLLPGEWLRIAPSWESSHIVSAPVPILGTVRCNRALVPQLRAALAQVQAQGLGSLVHTNDYGGCYAARVIPGGPGEALSAHAWGAAIDINVSPNLVGATPHQDPRLVAIFKRWGFTWGGNWLRPDGMHFEFQCFPPGMGPAGVLPCPPGGAIWPPT
jgi:D-alanyl-D-alanine carboxypeptidase